MAINDRQTNLLVQQDWTKIYQTFKEADFQSYDFETLRKTMIDYLRTYYPEDFNDFTESSEYIALIDLIAFLGQSLAFRADLNARENFIDTAERRDSVLKLARLISYNPKRNICSSGYLKVSSVSTTESVTDSNGIDLSNLLINWNDPTNSNWQEQFNAIMNATLVNSQVIGRPGNSQVINSIKNDEYTLSIVAGTTPTYRFTSTVEGSEMTFEAVSATSVGKTHIYEDDPAPRSRFNLLFRSDGLGNDSVNTGFFVYFKQGEIGNIDFTLRESIPNRTVSVDFDNINQSDCWLYSVGANGAPTARWNSVPAVSGVNIAYNKSEDRNIYQINTKINDQVELIFGDGAFSNVPRGNFRFYYRRSNGLTYKITPDEMQGISIPINYVSRSGRIETLTLRVELKYTIANATARESLDEIRTKAPQQYYTQNRMITGEDYNILPYTTFSTILKAKAVNRTSSGTSRFLDVLDVTGKYSSTNVFGSDGSLYRDQYLNRFSFSFQTNNEIYDAIYNRIYPILTSKSLQHFHYAESDRFTVDGVKWKSLTRATNVSTGNLVDGSNNLLAFDTLASDNLKHITVGAMMRFRTLPGFHFSSSGKILPGPARLSGDQDFIYAAITREDLDNKILTINQIVPDNAILDKIIPAFENNPAPVVQVLLNLIRTYRDFGLRYDTELRAWRTIKKEDLPVGEEYSSDYAGDTSNYGRDASWLIKFVFDGKKYNVSSRALDYYFESAVETKFYFDDKVKVFDSKTGKTINDYIKILKYNTQPDSSSGIGQDLVWYVYKNVVESDGYENSRKILVTFPDTDSDGVPDNPDLFEIAINPDVEVERKFVYFQAKSVGGNFVDYVPVETGVIVSEHSTREAVLLNINSYVTGQVFYCYQENAFYIYSVVDNRPTAVLSRDYIARVGRQDLAFQYRHNSPNQRRIDPSPNNIMDLYILTKTYATDYMTWIRDSTNTIAEPSPPTNEELRTEFNALENYKAMSDTIIYNSVRFKPLFGPKAEYNLRAKFKVVKNPNVIISDNDIKTSVISAINTYFDVDNWDFGETFYFSELSAYLHRTLSPNIASVIMVPANENSLFGNLYQINAQSDEIVISAATVDDVEVIPSITATQLNQTLNALNSSQNPT